MTWLFDLIRELLIIEMALMGSYSTVALACIPEVCHLNVDSTPVFLIDSNSVLEKPRNKTFD